MDMDSECGQKCLWCDEDCITGDFACRGQHQCYTHRNMTGVPAPRVTVQPDDVSCLPACLSMLLDLPYPRILERYSRLGIRGYTDSETLIVALTFGAHLVPIIPSSWVPNVPGNIIIHPQMFIRMLEEESGLLLGNSVATGRGHSVVIRMGKLTDPANGNTMEVQHFNDRYNVEVFYLWANRHTKLSTDISGWRNEWVKNTLGNTTNMVQSV